MLAAGRLLYSFSHLDAQLNVDQADNRADMTLAGAATFVRLPKLATQLESVPVGNELQASLQQLQYIDHACHDLLMNADELGAATRVDWRHAGHRLGLIAREVPRGDWNKQQQRADLDNAGRWKRP